VVLRAVLRVAGFCELDVFRRSAIARLRNLEPKTDAAAIGSLDRFLCRNAGTRT
jgi:hypothetical protein